MNSSKFVKTGILICFVAVLFTFWGCTASGGENDRSAGGGSREASHESQTTQDTVSQGGIAAAESTGAGIGNAESTGAGIGKERIGAADDSAKGPGTGPQPAKSAASGAVKDQDAKEYSVTLKGSGLKEEVVFTETDIRNMKTETFTYSFRNKEKNNERQYAELTGVPLNTLLKAAGWNGTADTLRINCSDGYSNKYKLSEINGLFAYPEDGGDPVKVPAMLAVLEEGSYMGKDLYYKHDDGPPFRLIYGQEDYDSDFTKDFNSQGWGYYVTELKVE